MHLHAIIVVSIVVALLALAIDTVWCDRPNPHHEEDSP